MIVSFLAAIKALVFFTLTQSVTSVIVRSYNEVNHVEYPSFDDLAKVC